MLAPRKNESGVETSGADPMTHKRTDWNLKELLERVDDDQEFVCELLRIFREDSQSIMEKAKTAMEQHDLPGMMRAAHTMKGMLRNLSMNGAGEIAFSLETAARDGNGQAAAEFLASLEQAIAELLPEVEAQLAEVKA